VPSPPTDGCGKAHPKAGTGPVPTAASGAKAARPTCTLGQLLCVVIAPANEQERNQVGELC